MTVFIFFLLIGSSILNIYVTTLYYDLQKRGFQNISGRRIQLKSLKKILSREMTIENKRVAEKCLKLYYGYLIFFYSGLILTIFMVVSNIKK